MSKLMYKSKMATPSTIKRAWFLFDANGQTLGRMCAKIAPILRGKNKPSYTPHMDTGDYVIVINSKLITLSGNKLNDKDYLNYSGYPGGLKSESARELIKRRPNHVIERGVKGMLPKNRLGRAMYKKLFVYDGPDHPHSAQQPQLVNS
jgi:large subunit ribosomal protein L13